MQHGSGDYASAEYVKTGLKVEGNQDAIGGVEKFRAKLLPESAGKTTMDVPCQMEHKVNLNADMANLSLESCEQGKMEHAPINSSMKYLEGSDEVAITMSHNVTGLYRDDVVKSSKPENMLGLGVVMEVPGDSESEDDISDDSDDDGEGDNLEDVTYDADHHNGEPKDTGVVSKNDSLSDGEIRIMWLDGTETTNDFGDIVVIDRGFLHGDLVASVTNPTGQLGLVVDVHVTVDLRSPDDEILRNVSSVDLKRIREFTVGDYVIHGPWLGRVEDVLDNVTVTFDDGAVCKVMKADPLRLKPVSKSIVDDSSFPYYPGQRVRAASSSIFKGCRWFSGPWKANRLEGTVTKVQAGSVFVYWISSSNLAGANPDTVPPEEQNPKNLTLLSCFQHANWQLGEWCLFHPPQMVSSSIDNTSSEANENSIGEVQVAGGCYSENAVNGYRNLNIVESVVSAQSDSHVCNTDFIAEQVSDVSKSCEMANNVESELQTACFLDDESLENGDSCCSTSLSSANNSGSCKLLVADENGKHKGFCTTEEHSDSRNLSSILKEPSREGRFNYRKKLRKVLVKRENKGHRKDDPYERAFLIVNIMTRVDVAWQDGTREYGLRSILLIPVNSPGDHEFFPEQYVVEKASNEADEDSDMKRVGVVKSMDAVERTACIRWLKPVSRPEDNREFDKEEVVSAYELDEHPDYDYCYGDVVIRLSPVSTSAEPNLSEIVGEDHEGYSSATHEEKESGNKTSESDRDMANHGTDVHESDFSWVGHITGLQDGDIEVTWADGMVSKVGPQAIYVVGRDDDGETFDGGSEYSDGASWETVEDDDPGTQITVEEAAVNSTIHNKTQKDNSSANVSEAAADARNNPLSSAIGFMTRLASGIFSRGRILVDSSSTEGRNENENSDSQEDLLRSMNEPPENKLLLAESNAVVGNSRLPTAEKYKSNSQEVSAGSEVDHPGDLQKCLPNVADDVETMKNKNTSSDFKHFDMTRDPLDHYFIGNGQASGARKWVKKVQQEWNILEKNLPDAIYVRTFEDRMDLLRAVIVGACGTPYQDGLFFFDFYLSPEYPQVPPTAYYHSGGLRVNPNLYEDGKVCLSLLNTWTGKGNEVWDPSSSSILQVLVSIQGLVLNSKPYFNEAGYEKQIGTVEGEKNCLPYNENTFLLNLKSMMYILRRPPMHFEELVKDHFRRRGYYILKACDAYMKGYLVGTLTKDACLTEESHEHPCSVGFKLMLAKIIPRLFSALSEVGADCHEFKHLLKSG